jgi:HPr kinase/phosphorylase
MHGSCIARDGDAVLIVGPSGTGKSDLALRLLSHGFQLIADDQVDIADGVVSSPAELAGLLEARGIGIVRLPYRPHAKLALIVDLGQSPPRLPEPLRHADLQVPLIYLDPSAASAPERVCLALDCALGRVTQIAGAFAAS